MSTINPQIETLLLAKCSVVEVAQQLPTVTLAQVYSEYRRRFSEGKISWSPYSLVQERVQGSSDYPWKVIVLCALMNRTHARQVRPILRPLFLTWPTPSSMANATKSLEEMIRPLGFFNRRAESLRRMSYDYYGGVEPESCRGVGQFGKDGLNVFVHGRTDYEPEDGFLGKYVRWRRTGEVLFDGD